MKFRLAVSRTGKKISETEVPEIKGTISDFCDRAATHGTALKRLKEAVKEACGLKDNEVHVFLTSKGKEDTVWLTFEPGAIERIEGKRKGE